MNEAENLAHVLPRIPREVHEVILVDGHSHDDTIAVAQRLLPGIRIVQQQGRGKGAALRTGFAAASGDIIVMIDADGSTAPEEIPAFVRALTDGADYAKGSRFMAGGGTSDMPLHRKLGNMGFVYLVRLFFGGKYTDLCYGYNAFWRHCLPHFELDCDGFEIEAVMNIRAACTNLAVREVPSFEERRLYGQSHLHVVRDGLRILRVILSERFVSVRSDARPSARARAPAPRPSGR